MILARVIDQSESEVSADSGQRNISQDIHENVKMTDPTA
jgi:hypothetical protein